MSEFNEIEDKEIIASYIKGRTGKNVSWFNPDMLEQAEETAKFYAMLWIDKITCS